MRTNSTNPRQLTAAERRRAVLELKRKFLSFDEIGQKLGISKQAAHKAYKKALGELNKQSLELADELRTQELDVVYRMRRKSMEIVDDPRAEVKERIAAIKLVQDSVATVGKLTGCAAPISVETKSTLVTNDLTPEQVKHMATLWSDSIPAVSADADASDESEDE